MIQQVWNLRRPLLKSHQFGGRLAQLGERIVRNDEAGGSNPLPSTNFFGHDRKVRRPQMHPGWA